MGSTHGGGGAPRREDIERPEARGCDTLTRRAINETKGYGNINASPRTPLEMSAGK